MAIIKRQLPFHAFTIKHNALVRRIVIDVRLSVAFDPDNPPPADKIPALHPVKALWDTGATASVVTPGTAAALGLIATGAKNSQTAGGVRLAKTYIVMYTSHRESHLLECRSVIALILAASILY